MRVSCATKGDIAIPPHHQPSVCVAFELGWHSAIFIRNIGCDVHNVITLQTMSNASHTLRSALDFLSRNSLWTKKKHHQKNNSKLLRLQRIPAAACRLRRLECVMPLSTLRPEYREHAVFLGGATRRLVTCARRAMHVNDL